MTTDKTPATLATVKHGGCVQLGDGLLRNRTPADYAIEHAGYLATAAQRLLDARGELDALVMRREEEDDVDDGDMHAAQECVDEASTGVRSAIYDFEKRRDRALSAQPSPGGQGDALEQALEQAWKYFNVSRDAGEFMWNAALAAHPPVRIYGCCAQPEGELHTAECPNMRHLAARQPVCATVKDSLTVGGGQPLVWVSPGQLEEFRNGTSSFGSRIPARIEKGGLFDMPLYATPPAQAVDLGQFRQPLESWKRKRERSLRNAIEAGKGNQLVEGLRRNLEEADRLLALIDSQAVGK